jgi:hypothetical protein
MKIVLHYPKLLTTGKITALMPLNRMKLDIVCTLDNLVNFFWGKAARRPFEVLNALSNLITRFLLFYHATQCTNGILVHYTSH